MKFAFPLLTLVICLITNSAQASQCFLVKENGKILKAEGDCKSAYAPNSTFKIALSLMGYDAKILKNENSPNIEFKPEYAHNINVCKGDHNPREWMRDSCVWFSQVLTKQMGVEKFSQYVNKFNYGNKDISGDKGKDNGLTNSWLSSSLVITPDQQHEFLQNLIDKKLGVSNNSTEMTKKILFSQEHSGGWKVYGKTGNGRYSGELQQGWFVGWIEKGNRKITFVSHIKDETKQPTSASFRAKSEAITKLWYVIDDLAK